MLFMGAGPELLCPLTSLFGLLPWVPACSLCSSRAATPGRRVTKHEGRDDGKYGNQLLETSYERVNPEL